MDMFQYVHDTGAEDPGTNDTWGGRTTEQILAAYSTAPAPLVAG